MRLSKLRNSSLVIPATSSADFASQTCIVYTDKHALFPLLMTPPRSICTRNLAGTAMRPFASIVCSCSPRNIAHPSPLLQLTSNTSCSGGPLRIIPNILPYIRNASPSSPTHRTYSPNSPLPPPLPHFDYNR